MKRLSAMSLNGQRIGRSVLLNCDEKEAWAFWYANLKDSPPWGFGLVRQVINILSRCKSWLICVFDGERKELTTKGTKSTKVRGGDVRQDRGDGRERGSLRAW